MIGRAWDVNTDKPVPRASDPDAGVCLLRTVPGPGISFRAVLQVTGLRVSLLPGDSATFHPFVTTFVLNFDGKAPKIERVQQKGDE